VREHRDWSVDRWKRVAWSDESRFRLLNANGRLRVWGQALEIMAPARQVGTVQGMVAQSWSGFFFRCTICDLGACVSIFFNAIRYVELPGGSSIRLCQRQTVVCTPLGRREHIEKSKNQKDYF
ncbi:hypothetical protein TNCV_4524291, partial [Trichonephila clavipes]